MDWTAFATNASNIGSAFGNVGSAVGSLASGVASLFGNSGGTSLYKSAKLMKAQNTWQKRYDQWYLNNITKATALNEYPWKRRSLESAGFNPVLAYMSPNVSMPSAGSVPSANATQESRAQALVGAMEGFNNMQLVNAQTAKLRAETQDIENKPENLLISGLKGLFGFGNKDSSQVANQLGRLGNKFGMETITKLRNKLIKYSSAVNSVNNSSDTTGAYQLYVSNLDDEDLNVHFTKKELKIIEEAEKRAKGRTYNKPPKQFPI